MTVHDLMTIPEVAEMLRRTPSQVRWMRKAGTGPQSARIAGRVYFRRADVERFIEEAFERENTKEAV